MESNKALLDHIHARNDEIDRWEQFSKHYQLMSEKYLQFEELSNKKNNSTFELQGRLKRELAGQKQRIINLKNQLGNLEKTCEDLGVKNVVLLREFNESIQKLRGLQKLNRGETYYNLNTTSPLPRKTTTTPNNNHSILNRLCNENL